MHANLLPARLERWKSAVWDAYLRLTSSLPDARDERAFLPAALEIVETPPNPLGRFLAFTLCAGALTAIGWAFFGKIDIVTVAGGKLVSQTRTQIVQPLEPASVRAILVKPGQDVHAGDALIELDKTAALAEIERARGDLAAALLDRMRLDALLNGAADAPFATVANTAPAETQKAQAELAAQIARQNAVIAGLTKEKLQRIADHQTLVQALAKLKKTLPLIAERAVIRAKAAAGGHASIPAKLESQQLLIEAQAERDITISKIASAEAAMAELDQKIAGAEADFRATILGDLSKAQDRIRAAEEAFAKASRRADLLTLRAPISGTVQQMHVTGTGTVVTPAQQLLSIVPSDEPLEVEAVLENRDAGFVAAGQPVGVKVEAFPFTRYGLLRGTVVRVDRDAEATPASMGGAQGSQRMADQLDQIEASERLRYTVRIALQPGSLDVDGHPAKLLPGMSVKAEIFTGKRRIIDFLLSPLSEYAHDALRER